MSYSRAKVRKYSDVPIGEEYLKLRAQLAGVWPVVSLFSHATEYLEEKMLFGLTLDQLPLHQRCILVASLIRKWSQFAVEIRPNLPVPDQAQWTPSSQQRLQSSGGQINVQERLNSWPHVASHCDLIESNIIVSAGQPTLIDLDPRNVQMAPLWLDPLTLLLFDGGYRKPSCLQLFKSGVFDDLLAKLLQASPTDIQQRERDLVIQHWIRMFARFSGWREPDLDHWISLHSQTFHDQAVG